MVTIISLHSGEKKGRFVAHLVGNEAIRRIFIG